MKITLNGVEKEISSPQNITQLLETLDLTGKPVVIEHNKTAIFPRHYPTISLQENDHLEIINIAAGG
ncbi:MAG: sulfur carrier protein ThiS [Akkermansiaceae bacterium]